MLWDSSSKWSSRSLIWFSVMILLSLDQHKSESHVVLQRSSLPSRYIIGDLLSAFGSLGALGCIVNFLCLCSTCLSLLMRTWGGGKPVGDGGMAAPVLSLGSSSNLSVLWWTQGESFFALWLHWPQPFQASGLPQDHTQGLDPPPFSMGRLFFNFFY